MGCYAAEAAALGKLKARIGQIRPGDASFATWRLILLTLTLSFEITNTQVLSCYCIFEKSSSSGSLSKELFLFVRRTPRTQRESEWRCLWPAKISHSLWVYFNAASNQCGNLNRQVFLSSQPTQLSNIRKKLAKKFQWNYCSSQQFLLLHSRRRNVYNFCG